MTPIQLSVLKSLLQVALVVPFEDMCFVWAKGQLRKADPRMFNVRNNAIVALERAELVKLEYLPDSREYRVSITESGKATATEADRPIVYDELPFYRQRPRIRMSRRR